MNLTREQIDAWQQHLIGKPCPNHPQSLIKNGKYGLWCGNRTETGNWCDGGWPTEEFINNLK